SCGIYIPGNVADFEIYDSVITDPTYGIQSYYQNTLNGFDAVNVTILNPSSRGISLRDSSSWGSFIKDIYLENVTVDGSSGEGIYITNSHPSSSNTTIVNSNVNGSSSHGISLTSMKSVILLDSNNVTSNGDSASEYGIYVTNSGITNLTVVDNVITRNSYGAYLQAALYSDVTLLDNQVSDNDNGIHLLGFSNHTLSPTNQIFNNTGTAFSLTSTDNVTLQDIVINYPHTTGVYLNANTNLTLSNVSILYSAGNAISFGGTSSNITFEDLTITDPASCGIYIPGNVADFEIYDSVITDPTYGIQSYYRNTLNGFDAVNVTILNPSSRGISLEESSSWGSFIKDAYLENVTVDCSSGDGIYIQNSYSASSNTTIVNSNVNGSSGYGIYLGYMRGTIVLENNTVSSSGSYGLDLHNSSITEVTLFNNTFDSNANGFRATRVTSNLNESVFNSSGGVDITLSSSDIDAYNTSFNTSRTSIDSNSELNVYWYMDVTVVDGFSSPVSSASVSIYNSTDSLVYSGSTSGSGAIPTQLFREFMDNSSRYYDSPYRILATKAATGSNESTFDLNASAGFTLMLLPEPPIITSWGNNQTSDNNLNLTIEKNSVVRFNATSDLVANWIWTNATYISGNTTVSSEAESAFNDVGNMLVYVVASNSNGSSNILQWNCTVVDTTGPASVSGLDEDSVGYTWINWTWTNPIDADFNHSMVYLNGSFVQNSSDAFFNATGLNDNSSYEIGIRTVDLSGNVNSTWINDTASTPLIPDITAPASVSVLGEDSIGYTWINWTWTNPSDSDFNYSMIYLNGSFVQNSSDAYFNATSLNDNSSYEVGIRTVDTSGNINSTWVNDTASTLLMPDTNAPASVTGLGEDSVGYEWINWTWTNPVDADFNYCMIYLNGSFVLNSSDTYFNATGLDEDSSYELAIRTVDTSYNVNSTWVNDTASTADDSTAPASVSDLNETAVSHNWINWTWTNPADSDFNYSTIYLNGIFLENASLEYCYVSNLDSNCTYEVGIRTVDIYGNVNTTWMNDTATTDVNPPVSEKKSSGGTGSATIRTNVDNVNDTVTNSSVVVDADKGEKSGSIGDSTSGNKTYASVLGAEETDDLGNGTKPEQQSPGFGSLFMVAGISIAFIILNRCRKA
ncbi:hypothetical protein J2755_000001, partial [Methanohalophilus levihalophilus]|uniref:right-handed parallel beta-helix repeat-containing protein n=1 Tax=Methanohalophilus levihalophilus TaxID=1431282 RepID=UPI001AE11563